MDKEKMEKAVLEMKELYDCGKYDKLNRIIEDENESLERRNAAIVISQFGKDPRRF